MGTTVFNFDHNQKYWFEYIKGLNISVYIYIYFYNIHQYTDAARTLQSRKERINPTTGIFSRGHANKAPWRGSDQFHGLVVDGTSTSHATIPPGTVRSDGTPPGGFGRVLIAGWKLNSWHWKPLHVSLYSNTTLRRLHTLSEENNTLAYSCYVHDFCCQAH